MRVLFALHLRETAAAVEMECIRDCFVCSKADSCITMLPVALADDKSTDAQGKQ